MKPLLAIFAEAASLQLKAHYLAHADVNVAQLAAAWNFEWLTRWVPGMPNWVIPLASIIAAFIVAVQLAIWSWQTGCAAARKIQEWRKEHGSRGGKKQTTDQ